MRTGARRSALWTSLALAVVSGAFAEAGEAGPTTRTPGETGGLRAMIARHAAAQGIPAPLADAVVRVESRYNPRARNGANLGLTQISYRTARAMGYAGTPAGLFEPETNLRFGMVYLGRAYRLANGDTCRTVLKYQAGHGAVTMTPAARAYCAKVNQQIASN